MATLRRTFLQSSAAFVAALPFTRLAGAESAKRSSALTRRASTGLLFDSDDLPRIRSNFKHQRLSILGDEILGMDVPKENHFLSKELRLNNHVADMARARVILERASFAYAVFGIEQHMALARLALRRLLDYRRWDYFLEGGRDTIGLQRAPEATIAACCALDWLGNRLTREEREETEAKISEEGAPACYRTLYGMKYPDRVRGWGFDPDDDYPFRFDLSRWPLILNATNLKVIPICGLGMAAVWLNGRHSDSAKWLQLARQSAHAFSSMYGHDGAFDEGAGYWGYTTLHLALFAEVLYRRLGIDDRQLINYTGTARYALALAMPTVGDPLEDPNKQKPYNAVPKPTIDPRHDVVNFSDAASLDVSVTPWIAHVTGDPLSQYLAQNIGGMKQMQALIWFRPEMPSQPPGREMLDARLSNDLVISRTGWEASDSVVALRSGGPANHEHSDRNSVIFKAYGERLFHDPFKAAYTPTNPRWLLRQTEAHTAVLIGGKGHQYHDGKEGTNASWANASVLDFRTGPAWMCVTSDATEAYALVSPDVASVRRSLLFLKPDVLLLADHVLLKTAATSVQLRFQVYNEDGRGCAKILPDGLRIERPHATLEAKSVSTGALTITSGKLALPESEGTHPFAEVASAPALEHVILTVCTAAPAREVHGRIAVERLPTGWRISGTHRGRAISASLTLPDRKRGIAFETID